MREKEFELYCANFSANADAVNACVNSVKEIEQEIGANIDEILDNQSIIKNAVEHASSKGVKFVVALQYYLRFCLPILKCKIPLFHGTRRYALEVSSDERTRFYNACKTVLKFANEYFRSDKINWKTVQEYRKTNLLFMKAEVVSNYGRPSYEYGDFYLTSSFVNAIQFSNNEAGELGKYAFGQCKGFADLGIELEPNVLEAVKIVEEEYPKYSQSERVILVFYAVDVLDLYTESGGAYADMLNRLGESKFKLKLETLYEDCQEEDNCRFGQNFRLKNVSKYAPLQMVEEKFKSGFKAFTKIKDIDKYIKDKKLNIN